MVLEIFLIRHAESEISYLLDNSSGEEQILAGATFLTELTENGKKQSLLLGKYFNELGIEFDKVATSPCVRTEQTLRYYTETRYGINQLCLRLSKVDVVPDLREHFQGDWEGMGKLESGYSDYFKLAFSDPDKFYRSKCPNRESPEEVGIRAVNYLCNYISNQEFSRVGLFTHRGTITWILYYLFHTPIPQLFSHSVKPASVTRLTFDSGEFNSYEPNIFVPIV